jgi:gas vesicle protein
MAEPKDDLEVGVFAVGAVIGATIGAALAYLFAPRSGKETRREIERVAEETRRRIEGESVDEALAVGKAEARRLHEAAQREHPLR